MKFSQSLTLFFKKLGDVSGTVEAIIDCLNGLCTPEIRVKVVGSGVGNISDGDIALAAACEGI